MSYKLNNVEISTYGAIPVIKGPGIALSGIFDLPKRKSPTEYNWGTSIEPFVQAEDIVLDGREISLSVVLSATTVQLLTTKINAFKTACVACTTLTSDFAEYSVVCKSEIEAQEYDLSAVVTAKFWQANYELTSVNITASNSGSYRIDNYDLQNDFGITVSSIAGVKNTPERIEVATTELYVDSQYRAQRNIELICFMKANSISDLNYKSFNFHALCYSPGYRQLQLIDGTVISLYFKDGYKAQFVAEKIIKFTLKAIIND